MCSRQHGEAPQDSLPPGAAGRTGEGSKYLIAGAKMKLSGTKRDITGQYIIE
jgi:hypothetical protein